MRERPTVPTGAAGGPPTVRPPRPSRCGCRWPTATATSTSPTPPTTGWPVDDALAAVGRGRRAADRADRLRPARRPLGGRDGADGTTTLRGRRRAAPQRGAARSPRPATLDAALAEIDALAARRPRCAPSARPGSTTSAPAPTAARPGGVVPRAHRDGQAARQGAGHPRPRRARRRAAACSRTRAPRSGSSSTASPATPRWPSTASTAAGACPSPGTVTFKNAQRPARGARGRPAGPAAGRDGRAVPHPDAVPRPAQRVLPVPLTLRAMAEVKGVGRGRSWAPRSPPTPGRLRTPGDPPDFAVCDLWCDTPGVSHQNVANDHERRGEVGPVGLVLPLPEAARYRRRLMGQQQGAGRHAAGRHSAGWRSPPAVGPGRGPAGRCGRRLARGHHGLRALDKTVTVSVDGHDRHVHGFARHGRRPARQRAHRVRRAHDLVAPSPASTLHDGETVVVRYGRPVSLTVDGETTHGLDDRPHRRRGPHAARRPLRWRLRLGVAQRPIGRGGLSLDVRHAAPPDLPRRRQAPRGHHDRDHPAQRACRGRSARVRRQDRTSTDLAGRRSTDGRSCRVTRVDGQALPSSSARSGSTP